MTLARIADGVSDAARSGARALDGTAETTGAMRSARSDAVSDAAQSQNAHSSQAQSFRIERPEVAAEDLTQVPHGPDATHNQRARPVEVRTAEEEALQIVEEPVSGEVPFEGTQLIREGSTDSLPESLQNEAFADPAQAASREDAIADLRALLTQIVPQGDHLPNSPTLQRQDSFITRMAEATRGDMAREPSLGDDFFSF